MEIVKNNDIIEIKDDERIVEKYSFDKQINFELLMEYLLKKNFEEEVHLTYKKEEFKDDELALISIIDELILKYNEKVIEFSLFKDSYNDN